MPDIASALIKLAQAIYERGKVKKADILSPYTITVPIAGQSITKDYSPREVKMYYVDIKVRSMGTATYVAVGRRGAIESRLTLVNSAAEFEAPRGAYIDASDIFIKSDTADAVVEVSGVLMPEEDK